MAVATTRATIHEPRDLGPPDEREPPRWGAERIRGELLKLGIRISKRTVHKHMKRRAPGDGQRWSTFI